MFSRPLKVDGAEIEMKKSTKFLGITLDSKLLWNEQLENVCKKSKGSAGKRLAPLGVDPLFLMGPPYG